MSTLARTWSNLPRVAKWIVLAAVIVIGFFGLIFPVLDLTNHFRSDSDRISAALQREKDLASPDSDDGHLLAEARRAFGKPLLPGDPNARAANLFRAIYKVLNDHLVEDPATNERTSTVSLRPEQLAALGLLGRSIERLTLEVSFESDPETAWAVLVDLESLPEVTSVGRVRVEKVFSRYSGAHDTDRTVRVLVAPEIWTVSTAPSSSAASGAGVGGLP